MLFEREMDEFLKIMKDRIKEKKPKFIDSWDSVPFFLVYHRITNKYNKVSIAYETNLSSLKERLIDLSIQCFLVYSKYEKQNQKIK